MIKSLTRNARKPKGLWGRLMIRKMNRGHAAMTDWALSLLPLWQQGQALDIGCGGGKAVRRLLKGMGSVTGVDYSELSVQRASRENRRAIQEGRAEILQADAANLPFAENTFDLATAIETIYFWPNPEAGLREALRVLRPGATLAVICEMVAEEGKPQQYTEVIELLKLHIPTQNGLEELLRRAGFDKMRSHRKDGWLCVTGEKPTF